MDPKSVDCCDVVWAAVTAAVRSEGLPSGKAGGVTPSLIAMAAPAARTLATPAPTMPVVDWSRVTVPRAGPVSVTMPVAKRARGTGKEPRRAQVVRTELRTYYTDCITHHRRTVTPITPGPLALAQRWHLLSCD